MKTAKLLCVLFAAAALAGAQNQEPPKPAEHKPEPVRKVITLRYANAREVASVLGVFNVPISANQELNVIAVSAPADMMPSIEQAVAKMDKPNAGQQDIDITAFLVLAGGGSFPPDMPADLQPALNQLKTVFPFQGFRLLDTVVLRTRTGNYASASGIVPSDIANAKTDYTFEVRPMGIIEDPAGRQIRLNSVKLHLRVPVTSGTATQFSYMNVSINTEITVKEGQKVVVGKSNIGGPDQALILVITARVVQ